MFHGGTTENVVEDVVKVVFEVSVKYSGASDPTTIVVIAEKFVTKWMVGVAPTYDVVPWNMKISVNTETALLTIDVPDNAEVRVVNAITFSRGETS